MIEAADSAGSAQPAPAIAPTSPTWLARGGPWLLAAALFILYGGLAAINHFHFRTTGFDLGIFEQAVRSYAHFSAPVADLKGPGYPLLGDHFHPILAVLAPLYWIFPSALTLLFAQAGLLAGSAVPVARLGIERLGTTAGLLIGAAYGLSWGIQQAVWFDFHEVAFAVPLIAASLVSLARRRWISAAAWAVPLLLVKEDQAVTVVAIGAYILAFAGTRASGSAPLPAESGAPEAGPPVGPRGRGGYRRLGAGLAAFGIVAGLLIFLVAIPAFNVEGEYSYFSSAGLGDTTFAERLFLPGIKWLTVLALLVPTGFLALRSPIVALALPTLAWRFWAANEAYWGMSFHYSAVLMPMVFVAMIDGMTRLSAARRDDGRRQSIINKLASLPRLWVRRPVAVGLVALGIAVLSAIPVAIDHRDIIADWGPIGPTREAHRVLDVIPDGARVSAANRIAPHLTNRATVYLFPNQTGSPTYDFPDQARVHGGEGEPLADWVALNDMESWPLSVNEYRREKAALGSRGYVLVATGGGVEIYQRRAGD